MIYRLVKMQFKAEEKSNFVAVFESSCEKIRAFKGCEHLQLWQDKQNDCIFFTYSHWQSEDDLNKYRNSQLFKDTWAKTKVLFDAKPEAWSVDAKFRLD